MPKHTSRAAAVLLLALLCLWAQSDRAAQAADPQPESLMGDWRGTLRAADGTEAPLCAQLIYWGRGEYQANLLEAFDQRADAVAVLKGTAGDGQVVFADTGRIVEGVFSGKLIGAREGSFTMHRVLRLSPTFDAKPPEGAIVLFDGSGVDEWHSEGSKSWRLVEDRAMEIVSGAGAIVTKRDFGDMRLHLEFMTPFEPEARGQGRGNSGVYVQARWEIQVLDSYGLEGRDNECGGLYGMAQPLVNMCAPPVQWQTFDMEFRAARMDEQTKQVQDAHLTVHHNGVLIHDVAIPVRSTGGQPVVKGPVVLQDHGNPVRFRNIWVQEM